MGEVLRDNKCGCWWPGRGNERNIDCGVLPFSLLGEIADVRLPLARGTYLFCRLFTSFPPLLRWKRWPRFSCDYDRANGCSEIIDQKARVGRGSSG